MDFGVYGAINWMFETEPWGVIIEDDCYVSQDFFFLCEAAFPRYNHEDRVMHIIANNPKATLKESDQVEFTYHSMSWGWGTWAHKWHTYMDVEMKKFPEMTRWGMMKKYGWFQGAMYYREFSHTYAKRHMLRTWDSMWLYSVLSNNGLCIMPMVNLAINNGIGTCEGTHYEIGEKNYYEGLGLGHLKLPVRFPDNNEIKPEIIKAERDEYFRLKMFGLAKKIRRILGLSR